MSKPRFASATAFDLLAVEPGQDSSSDEEIQEAPAAVSKPSFTTAKQTKTAQRKAAKAAREEKKRLRVGVSPVGTPESGASPAPPPPAQLPPTPPPEVSPVASPAAKTMEIPTPDASPPASAKRPADANNGRAPAPASIAKAALAPSVLEKVKPSPTAPPVPTPKQAPASGRADTSVLPSNDTALTTAAPPPPAKDAEQSKKLMSIFTRTLWTFIMIGGFIGCLLMGHAYMILLVMLCQMLVYREVTRLFMLTDLKTTHTERDVWSKTLNWYFFAVANYFLYGESIIYYFKHVVFAEASLLPFATNHRIISFSLYIIGFMGFVMSLQKGYLQQQFGLFCWVHMSLLLVVVSSHFIVNNILEGLIWFWVPASLVICNDIFAYIWGMSIGRTPLIKLSPKKTVEGFVGAFGTTIVFAILWGTYFSRFNYMICPVHDLGVNAWSKMQCTPNSVFVWREWQIWPPVAAAISALVLGEIKSLWYMPYQIHLFCLACFASLVAPFGGFFASGFKRAFNIKDFGHSIPGHGGMTDRMDCQFLMGVFTYVYYSNLIREHHVTVGTVLQTIVSGLTTDEQLELMRDLKHYLEGLGLTVQL